jgi:oligoendopeptidase F
MTHPYPQTGWTLADIFDSPTDPAIEQAITEAKELVAQIESLRPTLSAAMSGPAFAAALGLFEQFVALSHRLGSYGGLWFAADTQSQGALAFIGQSEQLLTELNNRVLFFNLWWKSIDDDNARRLMEFSGDIRYSLEQDRLFKNYTLSEAEEKIINLKDVNGNNALVTLYDMLTNKFVFELEVDGEKKRLTRGELMTYVRSPSAEVRAAAYQELYRVYGQEASILSQIYTHLVRDWDSEQVKLRGIPSAIAVRNLANDVPDSVVDTLLTVVAEQAPIFQRYFTLKAHWLGLPKLRRYDLYAPIGTTASRKIDYSQAVDMVLDSLTHFSPEFGAHARRVFAENHIDAEIRPTKRGGAFCASILPELTPWVLANYTGEPRDIATLAHELGHAIHAMLAAHHSPLTFHSALPLAETASVFAEMLLTDRLLAETTDPHQKRDLLVAAVDDAYATVLRQTCFVIFEKAAHQLIATGGSMDDLNALYLDNLRQQFGQSLDLSDDFQHEWIAIPHIYHTPFYCYAYSFGQLLALSLYQQYKNEGEAFKPRLLKILAYGGSASPAQILSEAGINMADPDFWRGGFSVIAGMITELESGS